MRPPRQQLPSTGSNTTAGTHGSSSSNATANPWGPFGNAATYGTDMALAVGILLSGFVLGLLLMLGVRYYLRRRRAARAPTASHPYLQKPEWKRGGDGEESPPEAPTLYSAGKTELAGAAAECAICLTEFAEGDALRVLPACKHGFHAECVERWLASSSSSSRGPSRRAPAPSCPVCRTSCLPPGRSPEPEEPCERAG